MSDLEKLAAVLGASAAGVGAVTEVVAGVERQILGVPLSALFAAIAGTIIGAVLLHRGDAARLLEGIKGPCWRRALLYVLRGLVLGVVVLGYAFVAAWASQVVAVVMPAFAGVGQVPLAGISGLTIRRMMPGYLAVLERVTAAVGGKP